MKGAGQFIMTPYKGKLLPNDDLAWKDFLFANERVEMQVNLKPTSEMRKKDQMYAYLYHVVYPAAMRGFERQGWEFMTINATDKELKERFLADLEYKTNTGQTKYYIEDKKSISQSRLHKYIEDVILFTEMELETRVPDVESYRAMMKSKTAKPLLKAPEQ